MTKAYRIMRVGIGIHRPATLEGGGDFVLLEAVGFDHLDSGLDKGFGRVRLGVAGDGSDLEGAFLVAEERSNNASALGTSSAKHCDKLGIHGRVRTDWLSFRV